MTRLMLPSVRTCQTGEAPMPTTQRFSEIAADALSIKLFGKKLEDLSVNMPSLQLPGQVSPIPAHTFAMVYCVYANGNCIDFTRPHLFLLPDNGTAPDGSCRTCNDATQYLMWVLAADAPLI